VMPAGMLGVEGWGVAALIAVSPVYPPAHRRCARAVIPRTLRRGRLKNCQE
jgi:hypothetical protein